MSACVPLTRLVLTRLVLAHCPFHHAAGERYGWCLSERHQTRPTEKDELLTKSIAAAAKEFPWVNAFADRSVTELELRAVLRSLEGADGGGASAITPFFFLRDPYYIESVPDKLKPNFASVSVLSGVCLCASVPVCLCGCGLMPCHAWASGLFSNRRTSSLPPSLLTVTRDAGG